MTQAQQYAYPPHSLEAEMAVLGAILVDREMFDVAAGIVRVTDFYAPFHERIFQTMCALREKEKPVDKITLAEYLRTENKLDTIGGVPYLNMIMDTVPTAASVEYYAKIVREKSALRALIHAGTIITKLGYEGEDDAQAAMAEAELVVPRSLGMINALASGTTIVQALANNYVNVSDRAYGEKKVRAQFTPWKGVNDMIGGFFPGEMIVWAAGPKMGKTAALTMLMDHASANYGKTVMFTLEMSIDAITQRLTALYSGVSSRKQRLGEVTDTDIELLMDAQTQLSRRNIVLFDLSCSRLTEMRRQLADIARKDQVSTVIIDHVNFMADVDASAGDRSSKHERLDGVYRGLLRVAKEFGCVMHVVNHVNRQGMRGRPSLMDIRDGGNPEGHAHAVIIPYRPNPVGTAEEREEGEFIIAAAREGDAGSVPMRFIGHRGMWLEQGENRPWFERSEAL